MKNLGIDMRLMIGVGAAAIVAAAVLLHRHFLQKPENPEDEEKRRRFQLNQVGRIVEGLVVELVETPAAIVAEPASVPAAPPIAAVTSAAATSASTAAAFGMRRLVRYSYSIAGVTYETAQDVTGLEERLCLERLAAGQPASVKYDPSNPSNSILVADDWSGIH